MVNKKVERACARYDKKGKVINHAVASIEWTRTRMKRLGLDPDDGRDRAFFKEICE